MIYDYQTNFIETQKSVFASDSGLYEWGNLSYKWWRVGKRTKRHKRDIICMFYFNARKLNSGGGIFSTHYFIVFFSKVTCWVFYNQILFYFFFYYNNYIFFIAVQLQLSPFPSHYSPCPTHPHLPHSILPCPLSLSMGPLYMFLDLTLSLLSPLIPASLPSSHC